MSMKVRDWQVNAKITPKVQTKILIPSSEKLF